MTMSKIKINPVTKEIEIEVPESFLIKYLGTLGMFLQSPKKVRLTKSEKKTKTPKSTMKKTTKTKKPVEKVTNIEPRKGTIKQIVLDVIKNSKGSISTKELIKETGLDERRVYFGTRDLKRVGIIKSIRRGLFEYVNKES